MVKRADAGAIVAQQRVAISPDDVALTLHHKLCQAARQLLEEALPAIKTGDYAEHAQQEAEATCFGRRTPEDSFLDWNKPAAELHNQYAPSAIHGRAHLAMLVRKNSPSGRHVFAKMTAQPGGEPSSPFLLC